MAYLAHIKCDDKGNVIEQTVKEHCINTAKYASESLETVGLKNTAYLIGLLHDAGKCKEEFQNYMIHNVGSRGSVNHTFAGLRMILEHFHNSEDNNFVNSEIIAYAIGSHHGLFDCVDYYGNSGFKHRMDKKDIHYNESKDNYLKEVADWNEIEKYYELASGELNSLYKKIEDFYIRNETEYYSDADEQVFYLSMLERMLVSSVIEGDRRDTAEFYDDGIKKKIVHKNIDWNNCLNNVESKLANLKSDSDINKARSEFSNLCKEFSFNKTGVYRLNLPTGSGKTLSSLRFALSHALNNNKKRIFFINPLLSILEQNAEVIKKFIGDTSIVLEHHSDSIDCSNNLNELNLKELAIENWDYPIVITTLVQFLYTLFSSKTSSIRRFNALIDAVIVIDEVQTVPNNMLSLFNLTVNFLSKMCNTTFVLCSATQPCLESVEHSLIYDEPIDIVPYDEKMWKLFDRTKIVDNGSLTMDEIIFLSKEIYDDSNNLLIICNKRKEASKIFEELNETYENVYHISASMCTKHRKDILNEVKEKLYLGSKIICISTQVIEAGVDISFDRVIRFVAGMDSIVQAAGRCNRNGEKEYGVVHIVECCDENLSKLKEIQDGKDTTIKLLNCYENSKEDFDYNLMSDASINWYYKKLFDLQRKQVGYHDFYVKEYGSTIYKMLTGNTDFVGNNNYEHYLCSAMKTAGENFNVFDTDTYGVVVEYDDYSKNMIEELKNNEENIDLVYLKDWLKRMRPYTVSVYSYQKDRLSEAIYDIDGISILNSSYYDNNIGINFDKDSDFLEV